MKHDHDLIARAKRGDSAAFGALYEEYAPMIYRFLRRRLEGSEDAVEDLTEDVFVKVFQKLDRYEERGLPFSAWLYRIAHNQLVDFVRVRSRITNAPLEAIAGVAAPQTGVAFGRVLEQAVLEPALSRLTEQQRLAVQLRFLDGLSVADTARLMGRSEDAVKKLQARALVNLRSSLATVAVAEAEAERSRCVAA